MHIGERIRNRRLELEWSQRELARRMNYSNNSTIAKIEQGKVEVVQSKIVQFASVLGVSVPYLMGWEDSSADFSFKKKEFIKRVESMTDDELDRLEQILALVEGKE